VVTADNQINLRGLLTFFVGRAPYPGRIHWALAPVALGAVVYAGLLWRKAGHQFLAEGFGLATVVAIVTSYYAYSYDLLLLIVPVLAIYMRPADAVKPDKTTRYLAAAGALLLLPTPVYLFLKVQLHAEYLIALPLLALGFALARQLSRASLGAGAERQAPLPNGQS